MLLDLDAMSLAQQPGPGWWYVDGTFVRDSFERNLTATARILGVELRWSAGGLGAYLGDVTFTVEVAPTGQRFTTSDTSLLIDPLDAGVEHTFTVTATRSDGTTVQGPTVRATPQADPDPDCTDRSVARECRAATNWATVDPETMLVVNVSVCTPWQCGVDGEWGGRMPANSPWPNFLLIELDGPGGIGWKYVDGVFVDVRPREEPGTVVPPAPPATEPSPPADAAEGSTDASTADPEPPASAAGGPDAPVTDPSGTDAPEPTASQPEAPAPTAETTAPSGPASRTDAPAADSPDGALTSAERDETTEASVAPAEAAGAVVDERPAQGPIRRALAGFVSFLRGIFGN